MLEWLKQLDPVFQALLATLFTWFVTALGAAAVFLTKTIGQKVLDFMLAFAGGVMIAASFWSLLAPGIEMAESQGQIAWIPAVVGFLLGGVFLRGVDMFLPHLHLGFPMSEAEGIKTSWHRSTLLVLAITLHNIPEGLAVGVAFGALKYGMTEASFARGRGFGPGYWDSEFSRRSGRLSPPCDVKACHEPRPLCMVRCPGWSSRSPGCWEPSQ